MMEMFIFYFSIARKNAKSKNLMQKVNVGKYRFTSRRGFEILSPPNQTSNLFNLRMHSLVLEMVVLMIDFSLAIPYLQ
jgi:hypothetical protein